ncbi:MAG: SGNH/GDSL hydrolase family protein [Planctomycetales bacterium]|nr:SGNH/GDSL hydrolase family protein [Planctomycetales bacterium]
MSPHRNWMSWNGMVLALAFMATADGAESAALRVLFVGNSYTYENNLPFVFQTLASSIREVECDMLARGGATLRSHLERGDFQKKLAEKPYDVVVVQEQSKLGPPRIVEGFTRIADTADCADSIRRIAAATEKFNARLVLFAHWPRADEPGNLAPIHNAYVQVGDEVGATTAPVGLIWDRLGGDDCDKLRLYAPDGSHPGPEGTYVAAAAIVRAVFGEVPKLPPVSRVPLMDGRAEPSGKFIEIAPSEAGIDAMSTAMREVFGNDARARQTTLPEFASVPFPAHPPEIMRKKFDTEFLRGTWNGEFSTFGLSEKATLTLECDVNTTVVRMTHGTETGWSPNDETSHPSEGPGSDGKLSFKYVSHAKGCDVEISLVRVGAQLRGLVRFLLPDDVEWVRSSITLSKAP